MEVENARLAMPRNWTNTTVIKLIYLGSCRLWSAADNHHDRYSSSYHPYQRTPESIVRC